MPPKSASATSRPSPRGSRRTAVLEEDESNGASGGKTPFEELAAAAVAAEEEEIEAGEKEPTIEDVEIPLKPHFKRLLKDFVEGLKLSLSVVLGLIVTYITKYFSDAEDIFEKPTKVFANFREEEKREEFLNIVLGTTFQVIPEISNQKSLSETKTAALQKFRNFKLPEEQIRALGATMGAKITRSDMLELVKVWDSIFVDQTVPKMSLPSLLCLSPSGILFGQTQRSDFRKGIMSPKVPFRFAKNVHLDVNIPFIVLYHSCLFVLLVLRYRRARNL